jgi:hypothetical protein
MEETMNSQKHHSIVLPIVIFIALAIIDSILIAAANLIANPLAQMTLISTGSAIFGAGLVFFLIRIIEVQDKT